jgi:hypothetical protein
MNPAPRIPAAVALILLGSLGAAAQEPRALAVPSGIELRGTLGATSSRPLRVVARAGQPPEVLGIVVVEDQLPSLDGAAASRPTTNTSYPFPAGDNQLLLPGGRPLTTRTLFLWGRNLPKATDPMALVSLSPRLAYRVDTRPQLTGIAARAWTQVRRFDPPTADRQTSFDTLVVQAFLSAGVTPGAKDLLLNGATATWPLMFSDQVAVFGFTRPTSADDTGWTDALFPNDVAHVELAYGGRFPQQEIELELAIQRRGVSAPQSLGRLSAVRLAGGARVVFRSAAIVLVAPGQDDGPTAMPEALRVAVRPGDRLTATLVDRYEAVTTPRVATATVHASPDGLGPSWLAALRRVAACNQEPTRTLGAAYALEGAGRLSPLLIGPAGVSIGKALAANAVPFGTLVLDPARARREMWNELGGRSDVVLRKGDHAAAILVRDEFVRLGELALGERSPGADPARLKQAVDRARGAGDCNLEELLVLAGQDAPVVVASVVRRLVRQDTLARPPRWEPDRLAQAYVKGLHTVGVATRALKELEGVDDAYKALALALGTAGVAGAAGLAGFGSAAAAVLVAGDVADAAIFGSAAVGQYFDGEGQYRYAMGASPVLGSDAFLASAEEARQSAFMTAVGVIAPGVGAGVGLRQLREARAIQRGRDLFRTADGAIGDVSRLSDAERRDLAAYFVDLNARPASTLDPGDAAALQAFRNYLAGPAAPGVPTASLPLAVPGASTVDLPPVPATPRPLTAGSDDAELVIDLADSDLPFLLPKAGQGGGPPAGQPPAVDLVPALPPVDPLSLGKTGPAGDRLTIEALHADRISEYRQRHPDAALFRDPATHVTPTYGHAVETLDLTGAAFRIDGQTYRRGDLRNAVPDDPAARSNGLMADVYDATDATGSDAPFVIKVYGERSPWDIDDTGAKVRRPSLDSSRAEDIEVVDDIEYGAGLLERIGVAQADLIHVEHRGPHPVIVQRKLGRSLPAGVIGEEDAAAAFKRLNLPDNGSGWLDDGFRGHRMAVLEMRKQMADAGVGWEDGHPGNFFFQRTANADGRDGGVRAAIVDQDRMDYVTDFGDGRRPKANRLASAALDHVQDRWLAQAPRTLRARLDRSDPHAMAVASLWHKGAFRFDPSGRPIDGWLKVDEIRQVFGDAFTRLTDAAAQGRRPDFASLERRPRRVPEAVGVRLGRDWRHRAASGSDVRWSNRVAA